MKPEKQNLLHDLLDDHHESRREAAFLAAGRVLRRKRWRRHAWQSISVAALLVTLVVSFHKSTPPNPVVTSSVPAPTKPDGSLTDEELLALFPNTPVGLATMADGKKRLVFPRPGDEERFVMHL
jgi:hypothetical protein